MKKATLDQASKILSVFEETPLKQVQDLLGSGLLADLRDANVANISRDEFRRVCGLASLAPELLLKFLNTITIPATTEPFIARNKFVEDTSSKAAVKIFDLGSNFEEWFLGKIEEPIQEATLRYQEFTRASDDAPIIAELGGEAKAEITLAQIFALMEIQKNGEAGALLSNGWANIFYVRDVNGSLRSVLVAWDGDGWSVRANSVEYPHRWFGGGRVFSSLPAEAVSAQAGNS